MQIMIGARASALEMAIAFEATHVVRIGRNLSGASKFFFLPKSAVLLLELESNHIEVAPIEELLRFVAGLPSDARLFIHCASGMTRSAATAIIAACATDRSTEPAEHFQRMLALNPRIVPNRKMMAIADGLLGLNGKLINVAEQDWADRLRNIQPLEVQSKSPEVVTFKPRFPLIAQFYKTLRFAFRR